jgi:hypothetical protein
MINMKWTTIILILVILITAIVLIGRYNQQPTGQAITPSSNEQAIVKTSLCLSVNGLPDANCTPGAIDTTVTQNNIDTTICVSGYTQTVRPSTSWTNPRKIQSIKDYGYTDMNTSDYEYDHLISLELGGAPKDTKNLWPEPYYGLYNSHDKDGFENYLHRQVCSGAMTLAEAQNEISTNWVSYWIKAGEP